MIALNVGCSGGMNWIQTKTKLLRRFPIDGRYLVGVSGGRDSVALLHWLFHLGYRNLVVCHLNHRLRGRSSDADARFVKKTAEKYGVEFELQTANVGELAKRQKTSIETTARKVRYAFFASAAKRHGCETIFLAHHADDLVETFLLNLTRGAGLTGLSAMRDVSNRCIDRVDLMIVRPLLSVWRSEIDKYVRDHDLAFREDSTNKNLTLTRNRIRHRIIPYLERNLERNIRENIWRTAIIAAEEERWINKEVPDSTGEHLSLSRLRSMPVALQRRAILKWLRAQSVSDVGFEVIEDVRALLDQNTQRAKVNLPRSRHVRRRAGRIFIEE
jgi:tRNA(Ile)-lysidine synthase